MRRLLLDTNLLVRLLAPEPPAHHEAVLRLFRRAEAREVELELRPLILAECVYVLESFYGVERSDIADALSRVVQLPFVLAGERETLVRALERLAASRLGFADCYLAAASETGGAEIVTFDAGLRKLRDVRAVDPQDL